MRQPCSGSIRKKGAAVFSPRLIFSALWLAQIVLHVVFSDAFYPFEFSTWAVIFFVLVFFNLGTVFSDHIGVKTRIHNKGRDESQYEDIPVFFRWFVWVYLTTSLFTTFELYRALQEVGVVGFDLPAIRQIVISDFNESRELYGLFRVFYLGVGFSIFFVACSRELSRKQLAIVLMIGLVSALMTTGRLYLLLYFMAVAALLYRVKIISPRGVLAAGFVFVGLFFLVALLLGKGDDSGTASLLESVLWNSQIYFMSSISCFNDYIVTGSQHIEGGAILPNPAREFLSVIGLSIPPRPSLNPFAEVPVPCNTYTFIFPLFHDGSFFGVAFGSFLIGIIHQYLYLKFVYTKNPFWGYLYAVSIYALFMTVFEDAYFSSPGFWLLLLIPPVSYYIFNSSMHKYQYKLNS